MTSSSTRGFGASRRVEDCSASTDGSCGTTRATRRPSRPRIPRLRPRDPRRGYATDPHYSDALIGIIRDNDLTQYDTDAGSRGRSRPSSRSPSPSASARPEADALEQAPMLNRPIVKAIQEALADAGCEPGPASTACSARAQTPPSGVIRGRTASRSTASSAPSRPARLDVKASASLAFLPPTARALRWARRPIGCAHGIRRDAVRHARCRALAEGIPSVKVDFDELYDALISPGASRGRV